MDPRQLKMEDLRRQSDYRWLRIVIWVIGISIVGAVACLILAGLKLAIESCLIIGGCCLVLALLCVLIYNNLKYRIHDAEFHRQMRKLQEQRQNLPQE